MPGVGQVARDAECRWVPPMTCRPAFAMHLEQELDGEVSESARTRMLRASRWPNSLNWLTERDMRRPDPPGSTGAASWLRTPQLSDWFLYTNSRL